MFIFFVLFLFLRGKVLLRTDQAAMADPRRAYVVGVARELLGVSKGSVVGEEAMEKFLNQSDVVLLQCSVGDDQSLLFSTSIGLPTKFPA